MEVFRAESFLRLNLSPLNKPIYWMRFLVICVYQNRLTLTDFF